MNLELWAANLLSYSLQVAVISMFAGALVRLGRVRSPEGMLAYWQALLGIFLLLPALEPWKNGPAGTSAIVAGRLFAVRAPAPGSAYAPVLLLFGGIIVAGVAARWMWLAIGYARLRRCRRRARRLDTNYLTIVPWRAAIGVQPAVYLSSQVAGPVTFGLRDPVVLLPESWLELEPGRQSAILCHEFLHVRRKDWSFHMAEEMIRALLWFHPAIWWLIAEIRLAREQVIDRIVVRLTGTPRPYIEALLAFSGVRDPVSPAPAFWRHRQLSRRISSILEEVSMTKTRIIALFAGITLCLAIAGVFAIRMFPLHAQNGTVHNVSEPGVTAPRVLYKVDPPYTQDARDAKINGTVVIGLEVHPDGKAHNLRIQRSVDPGLDHNALDAISNWRFQPAMKDGRPVAVNATIEVNFRLL